MRTYWIEKNYDIFIINIFLGDSEHENIKYKLGYDIGPSNPNPTNKEEERIFKEQRAEEAKKDRFEEMKMQSEAEKKELEQKFRRENLIPEDELKPPGNFFLNHHIQTRSKV